MRSIAPELVILALGVAMVQSLGARSSRPAAARSCHVAVEIFGELHCDEEIRPGLTEACGDAAAMTVRGGDMVQDCGEPLGRMDPEALQALRQPVDVNRAGPDELASLPGIGPTLAERIISGRPYAAIDELIRVHGIGPVRLAGLRPRARTEP